MSHLSRVAQGGYVGGDGRFPKSPLHAPPLSRQPLPMSPRTSLTTPTSSRTPCYVSSSSSPALQSTRQVMQASFAYGAPRAASPVCPGSPSAPASSSFKAKPITNTGALSEQQICEIVDRQIQRWTATVDETLKCEREKADARLAKTEQYWAQVLDEERARQESAAGHTAGIAAARELVDGLRAEVEDLRQQFAYLQGLQGGVEDAHHRLREMTCDSELTQGPQVPGEQQVAMEQLMGQHQRHEQKLEAMQRQLEQYEKLNVSNMIQPQQGQQRQLTLGPKQAADPATARSQFFTRTQRLADDVQRTMQGRPEPDPQTDLDAAAPAPGLPGMLAGVLPGRRSR